MAEILRGLLVGVILLGSMGKAVAVENITRPKPAIDVEIANGLLSLDAESATLSEVMTAIGSQAGFQTILARDFQDFSMGQVSLRDLSVLDAVRSLVNDENRIIFYRLGGAVRADAKKLFDSRH